MRQQGGVVFHSPRQNFNVLIEAVYTRLWPDNQRPSVGETVCNRMETSVYGRHYRTDLSRTNALLALFR